MPEEIAQSPAEQEKAAEGQQVGVDHPGERLLGEAEILFDRRQRDPHDRDVENDHQIPEAQNDQCEPAGARVHGHPVYLLLGGLRSSDRQEGWNSSAEPSRLADRLGRRA